MLASCMCQPQEQVKQRTCATWRGWGCGAQGQPSPARQVGSWCWPGEKGREQWELRGPGAACHFFLGENVGLGSAARRLHVQSACAIQCVQEPVRLRTCATWKGWGCGGQELHSPARQVGSWSLIVVMGGGGALYTTYSTQRPRAAFPPRQGTVGGWVGGWGEPVLHGEAGAVGARGSAPLKDRWG
jgi:hypothetical protein